MVDNIATSGVIHLGISDHSLIYAVRKFAVPRTRLIIKEVRNFKHFSEVDFIDDLNRVSWQDVECFDDPNLAWEAGKCDFNAILDHHAPIRHMRVRQSSVPRLTFDIKKMMKKRDYHRKHSIKYGSHNHCILYQSARNKVNSMMLKAKSDYFRLKIDPSKPTDPKAGWKLINSLTGKGNKSSPVNDILVNGKIVSDNKDISELFNDFFVNIGPTLAAESTKRSSNNVNTYPSNIQNRSPAFRFSNIPVENVELTPKNLKVSKSTAGLDNIPAKVLKIASSIIALSLIFI